MIVVIAWIRPCYVFNMYLRFCFLLSFVLCEHFADVSVLKPTSAEVTPNDPVFEEGDTIVLNCTLTDQFNGTENSSLLGFKHSGIVYGSEFVHHLTPQTAQLQIPNATLDLFGTYMCFLLPNISLGLAQQFVAVLRRPLKPNVTHCVVFNWESLSCSWIPTKEEQRNHSKRDHLFTAVIWHVYGFSEVCRRDVLEDRFNLSRDGNVNIGSCNFQMGHNYTLQIEVANIISSQIKNVTSDPVYIATSNIVCPNPPENVTYSFDVNVTTMTLHWNPPMSTFRYDPLLLAYAVSYRSDWNMTTTSLELLNETSITLLCNPFTNYTVSVKVRPLPTGYWSNKTTLNFQTPSTVPCEHPKVNPGGFVLTSANGLERAVTLYWKSVPVNRHCGPEFNYVVSMRSSENWQALNETILDTNLDIFIGPNETEICIWASNRKGFASEQPDVVRIPSFPTLSPVTEVIVEIDVNLPYASISWDYSFGYKNITRTVIFWCTSGTKSPDVVRCKNDIEWEELDRSQRQFNISDSDIKLLRAGISVDLLGIGCGIKWSTTVYALDIVSPPPEKVDAVIPHGADHGHVYVSWEKPKCRDSLCGYVNQYILFYCISGESHKCTESNQSVSIVSTQSAYNLTGLSFGSTYLLWMLSSSKAGLSKSSVVVTVHITKPWKTIGAVIGIAIGALVTAVIVVCGLYGIYRFCRKYEKKFTRGVEVVLPKGVPVSKVMKSSSEMQILYDSYQSGCSRQSSESGHYLLADPCTTSNVTVLQQSSTPMSKPNGTLTASAVTPLIGIREDGATGDVLPEMAGNNCVKTVTVEDPDDGSGYKVIRTVDSLNDDLANSGQPMPKVQLMRQPEVWVCSSPSSHAPLLNDGLFTQMPVIQCNTASADKCAYIQLTPDTNLHDIDTTCKSPLNVPDPAVSMPVSGTITSYAAVEMLNPHLSIPASHSPGNGLAGDAVESGYTDLTFLTNILLDNSGRAGVAEQQVSQTEMKLDHQSETVSPEEAIGSDFSQSLSFPLSSDKTSTNSELNGNNNSDFKSLTDPIGNCLILVSSDQNSAHFRNSLGDSHPVSLSTQSNCPSSAKELDREVCAGVVSSSVPAQRDDGYILHNDLLGNM